jgi:uncharacterized protein (TIGR03437 family)
LRPIYLFDIRAISLVLLATAPLLAQPERLPRVIDNAQRRVLAGQRNPRGRAEFDQGPVELSRSISGISLHFKPGAAQQAELEKLLVEQQDPGSPNYHNWLTPDEYADRFGLSRADLDKVASWLRSWGFHVDYTARSRNWITFRGDAGQVLDAFHTEIHRYRVKGEMHYANAADPSLPSALAAIVQTITGLDDFRLQPRSPIAAGLPRWTASSGLHAVTPGDLATIYDINKLYLAGISGNGQSMVVVGQTNINMSDVESFRKQFGLVANDPKMVLVPGFPDPGISKDDLIEALLDLQYSGATAPNASILFVYSPNVIQSLLYAIDQNLAPVISMSYGACEATVSSGSGTASAYRSVAQQANAEGITWIASSGDSGAADCELQGQATAGSHGPSVDMPASIPEVTGVGGSEFNESGKSYWNNSNSPTGTSALSYIPEMAWNDTAIEGTLAGGGGGASIFYSKPAWQTGPGVPNDGARDVPDVALTASGDHDPYLVTMNGNLTPVGGTSAAAPVFAGIITLLNQYLVANNLQAKPGLGNINPNLYLLAGNTSTATAFHDITVGDNIVPCSPNSTGCKSGSYGYRAGPGYDQATGLGSVDAYNLATLWKGGGGSGGGSVTIATSITATANPAAITVNSSAVLTATVRAASGSASPTGSISFNLANTALGTVNLSGSGGTATASITVYGSQLTIGNNTVSISYSGTTTFLPSRGSVAVAVTVPTTASAVIPSVVPNPIYQQDPDADGYAWFYTVRLAEVAGTSTTLTGFSIDGTDHTADISAWFGSTSLPAHGTLSASIRSRGLTVPVNRVFLFNGRDNASGQTWTQQLSIPFLPQQLSASMVLSSSPGTEVQNPNGDPNCPAGYPFYQQLNLQEKNGYEVILNKFLAGGNDWSSNIAGWFGSLRLAPLSSLQANICWKIGSVPSTLSYEVDGLDTAGYKISTTLSVPFSGPGQNAGKLASSPASVLLTAAAGNSTASSSVNLTLPSTEQWTVSVFPANQKTSWLVVYPQSGTGPAQVNLVASAAGVAAGVYKATLVFQSVNTIPQFVNVPVTFTVGASSSVSITGISNGASFQQVYAPGMVMSVFGTGLANSTKVASSVPLPVSLDGVSATVNGVPAPLYFISSGQLNVQVPYETAIGSAILGINNNGKVATTSFNVKTTAPGIFTAANGSVVPISSARPGDPVFLYVTGDGDTTPHLASGATPAYGTPYNQLPAPLAGISMSVANIPVTPFFVGIPSGLVGVTQINFNVPSNAPLGLQSVIVTLGGVASKAAALNVTNSPTAAVSEALPFAFLPEAAPPLLEIAPLIAPAALPGTPEDAPQKLRGLP